MNKDNLKKKIVESKVLDNLKAFLILNIDKFSDEQVEWLMKNL